MKHPSRASLLRALVLPLCAFLGGASTSLLGSPNAQATGTAESPHAVMGQLARVLVEVENGYVEPVDRAKLLNGAIKGMVAELDPHSSYMTAQDFAQFMSDTEGKFGGVGIEVDPRSDALIVIAPIEGSPAERKGVKSGDRIIAIDGFGAEGQSLDKLVRRMRGAPDTHVKITVKREGTPAPIEFDLVREVIRVKSVAARLLDGNVLYLRIKQFQEHTHDEMLEAIGRVRGEAKGSLVGTILDLRNNTGGLVDEAAEVADEFLASGTIYTTRHRGQIIDDVKAKGGGALSAIPIVLLVNEYSASASELVAGALQDHRRAIVVGTNTFGKGSVQSILSLPGGAGVRLTTARYYTPSGHAIQADGVHPDVAVESKRAAGAGPRILRERDLEGHLHGEGTPRAHADAGAPAALQAGEGGTVLDAPMKSDARNVPQNPTAGSDFVLRLGYETLKPLVGRGPLVK